MWLWTQERRLEAMSVGQALPNSILQILNVTAASGTVKKVIEINPYLLGTMAGGAGMLLVAFCMNMFLTSDANDQPTANTGRRTLESIVASMN